MAEGGPRFHRVKEAKSAGILSAELLRRYGACGASRSRFIGTAPRVRWLLKSERGVRSNPFLNFVVVADEAENPLRRCRDAHEYEPVIHADPALKMILVRRRVPIPKCTCGCSWLSRTRLMASLVSWRSNAALAKPPAPRPRSGHRPGLLPAALVLLKVGDLVSLGHRIFHGSTPIRQRRASHLFVGL